MSSQYQSRYELGSFVGCRRESLVGTLRSKISISGPELAGNIVNA